MTVTEADARFHTPSNPAPPPVPVVVPVLELPVLPVKPVPVLGKPVPPSPGPEPLDPPHVATSIATRTSAPASMIPCRPRRRDENSIVRPPPSPPVNTGRIDPSGVATLTRSLEKDVG